MKRAFWVLVYLLFFVAILGGIGYGIYEYFLSSKAKIPVVAKTESQLSAEYLDTLVVDIQSNLNAIKSNVDKTRKSLNMVAMTTAILCVVVIIDFIFVFLLCLVILRLRAQWKKNDFPIQR